MREGAWLRRRRTQRAKALGTIFVLTLLASACGSPKYEFVANRDHGHFFKVPASWDLQDVTAEDLEGRATELPPGINRVWHETFSSPAKDRKTSVKMGGEDIPTVVRGSVEILELSDYYRQTTPLSSARGLRFWFPIDPLYVPQTYEELVRLVAVNPLGNEADLTGTRVVVNVIANEDVNDPFFITWDQSVIIDDSKGVVYMLNMWCTAQCYLDNRAEIDNIAISWKVRELV